jgi:hypothetical protein
LKRKQKGKKGNFIGQVFGTSFMKQHVEVEHSKAYVVEIFAIEDMGGSQSMNDEGTRYM